MILPVQAGKKAVKADYSRLRSIDCQGLTELYEHAMLLETIPAGRLGLT